MNISWEFPYPSQRMPTFARNVVATSQPLAAQAGLQMLAGGGNALDAALATAIALTVVEPTSNGIGSDAFALVWNQTYYHDAEPALITVAIQRLEVLSLHQVGRETPLRILGAYLSHPV